MQLQLKTKTNVGGIAKKKSEKVEYLRILVENSNTITMELKLSVFKLWPLCTPM